jgi:hypothetical protein
VGAPAAALDGQGVAFMALLAACDSNAGIHQAEVLPTPIPSVVLAARATNHKCALDDT